MSAERLREAARVLREQARQTESNPWHSGHVQLTTDGLVPVWSHGGVGVARASDQAHAVYIATMHPGVGLALADWLDATTCGLHCGADGMRFPYCSACEDSTYDHECPKRELCKHTGPMRRALAIADLILGDAS